MSTLSTTELLEYYTAFEAITDEEFIGKTFLLEEIYSLYFKSDIKGLFWEGDGQGNLSKIIKLSGQYYLVGIAPEDEYRDTRSLIYHLRCEQMQEMIFQHDLINEIPCPLEVYVQKDKNSENKGLIFNLVDYSTDTPLLVLTTEQYGDYYPRGVISFDASLLREAIPNIEKKKLEAHTVEANLNQKKIKI